MSSTISLCLIVKNGEATLPACFRSAVDLCSETIVDTGWKLEDTSANWYACDGLA